MENQEDALSFLSSFVGLGALCFEISILNSSHHFENHHSIFKHHKKKTNETNSKQRHSCFFKTSLILFNHCHHIN